MARFFFIALCVFFAVYVLQAHAAPAEETTTQNSIEAALKSASDSISKAYNDAKPELDKILAKSQDFFDDIGKKIKEEAEKIIPKTDAAKP